MRRVYTACEHRAPCGRRSGNTGHRRRNLSSSCRFDHGRRSRLAGEGLGRAIFVRLNGDWRQYQASAVRSALADAATQVWVAEAEGRVDASSKRSGASSGAVTQLTDRATPPRSRHCSPTLVSRVGYVRWYRMPGEMGGSSDRDRLRALRRANEMRAARADLKQRVAADEIYRHRRSSWIRPTRPRAGRLESC